MGYVLLRLVGECTLQEMLIHFQEQLFSWNMGFREILMT